MSCSFGGTSMLTGAQTRAARALVKWSAHDLAARSGVSYSAIQRAELAEGMPNILTKTFAAIKCALEEGGVEFFDGPYSGDAGPGVQLGK